MYNTAASVPRDGLFSMRVGACLMPDDAGKMVNGKSCLDRSSDDSFAKETGKGDRDYRFMVIFSPPNVSRGVLKCSPKGWRVSEPRT